MMKILKSCKQLRAQLANLDAQFRREVWLLGGMLLGGKAAFTAAARENINSTQFTLSVAHTRIFRAIAVVAKSEEDVTVVTVANELMRRAKLESVGGITYLCEICRQFDAQMQADLAEAKDHVPIH